MEKTKVAVIGCGNISGIYFKNLTKIFHNVEVVACSDLDRARAEKAAEEYGIPRVMTTEELLASDQVELVLNLTTPPIHYRICEAALNAGKHVYVEKPLSLTREEGKKLVELAREKKLLLGGAPDTFLGGGLQTCRKLVEDGWIGKVVGGTAFMTCHGHESWHPDPEFYYQKGGGPLLDMGPYYLTALVSLIGPVQSVTGEAQKTFETRTITSEKKYGKVIPVEVPTHISALLRFCNGACVNLMMSFDVWEANLPRIELYGTEGSLSVPDPNTFGGPVKIRRHHHSGWNEVPLTHGYSENSRGYGVSDMAAALRESRVPRAGGQLAYHVLDIMHSILESAEAGKRIMLESTVQKPAPVEIG